MNKKEGLLVMSLKKESDELKIPENLPLLPVKDVVVFPYMILPLFVGRDSSIKAVQESLNRDRLIFLTSQKQIADDNPSPDAIFTIGTVAMIMRMRKLPDGRIKLLAQGICKGRIKNYEQIEPYYEVMVDQVTDHAFVEESDEKENLVKTVKSQLEKVITLGKMLSPDIVLVVEEIDDPGRLADLVTSNLGLKVIEAQEILETLDPLQRLDRVRLILEKELEVLHEQAKNKVSNQDEGRNQREHFLKEQMKAIKSELGDSDPRAEEAAEFRARIDVAYLNEEARAEALKQVSRLERMHPDSSEASIVRSYIEWICDLPWTFGSEDKLDLAEARKILDEDHYDLIQVKERILELLAVKKLKMDNKGPILCLVGAPGVGKTSLGKSIARSMGREFVRISLGGVHDEAEIRGHRRTYVGAMPGRIIQAIKQAGTNNPVIMLDEIDKLGKDYKGDPSSALLEVLDPEQNHSFRDHYLNTSFDLSQVLFLSTANELERIPYALKDRMEVIQLAGYSHEDKMRIARQYLIEKQIELNGITSEAIDFTDNGLRKLIAEYTREAGLRNFERLIGACARKVAHKVATWDGAAPFPEIKVTAERVEEFLGPPKYLDTDLREENEVGVCTGLAWTQMGGEVLEVEASIMKGKGGIKLTGSLGDVMKESCHTSWSWIRANASRLNLSAEWFDENEIHIHFPSGAVPKDGPSAGITITTAVVSLLRDIPVKRNVAMTGELSLRGNVLPIGGVKEKVLAALRHGADTIVIPGRNEKDLVELSDEHRNSLNFVCAKTIEDVLEVSLEKNPFVRKKISGATSAGGGGGRGKAPNAAKDAVGSEQKKPDGEESFEKVA